MPQLKRFKSHKIVGAAKITDIEFRQASNDWKLHLDLEDAEPWVSVPNVWVTKHAPNAVDCTSVIGGYFVVYQDGYESWSPAGAFEEGYKPIGPDNQPNPEVDRIPGYRHLTDDEIQWVEAIRAVGAQLDDMHRQIGHSLTSHDRQELLQAAESYRWLAEGKTDLQKGLGCWVRAITKPEFF